MERITAAFEDMNIFTERDTRLTQFGLWGLSGGLLGYAIIRHRPILRFKKARDIPDRFIRDKVVQRAIVQSIEPTGDGPVMLVRHKPPINLPSFSKQSLPIKVAGVKIDANGFSWLQTQATGKEIKFIPFTNSDKLPHCCAKVLLINENNKEIDLGKALMSLGFAKYVPLTQEIDLKFDKSNFERYYRQLQSQESKAIKWRQGQWRFVPENFFHYKLRTLISKLIFNAKPSNFKIPELVR